MNVNDVNAAFTAGSGGLKVGELLLLNVSIFSVLIFMIAAWILISAWRGWAKKQAGSEDFGFLAFRLILLISLALLFYTT